MVEKYWGWSAIILHCIARDFTATAGPGLGDEVFNWPSHPHCYRHEVERENHTVFQQDYT
jgi:hypothetical protein